MPAGQFSQGSNTNGFDRGHRWRISTFEYLEDSANVRMSPANKTEVNNHRETILLPTLAQTHRMSRSIISGTSTISRNSRQACMRKNPNVTVLIQILVFLLPPVTIDSMLRKLISHCLWGETSGSSCGTRALPVIPFDISPPTRPKSSGPKSSGSAINGLENLSIGLQTKGLTLTILP